MANTIKTELNGEKNLGILQCLISEYDPDFVNQINVQRGFRKIAEVSMFLQIQERLEKALCIYQFNEI